jgi:hypothetical protein
LRKQEATLKSNGHAFRKRAASQSIGEIIQGIAPRQMNIAPKSSSEQGDTVNGAIGKNEGTVRFLFGPAQD